MRPSLFWCNFNCAYHLRVPGSQLSYLSDVPEPGSLIVQDKKIMSQDNAPVWFITGCSTGFGREIARLVLGRGWRAVVTARNPEKVASHRCRA
jgi:hypothetical protein